MSANHEIQHSCNEEFAELCALSTTGSLTHDEWKRLENHLVSCEHCRVLLAEYQSLTTQGMAKLAAEVVSREEAQGTEHPWAQDQAKKRLFSALGTKEPIMPGVAAGPVAESVAAVPVPAGVYTRNTALLVPVAAVFVLGVFSAYQVGVYKATVAATTQRAPNDVETSLRRQLAGALKARTALDEQLASSAKSIEGLSHRVARGEKELAHLKGLNASLEERTQALSLANQSQLNSLGSVSLQRDSLQRELTETQASLQTVRQELDGLQDVRQKDLQRTANLETEINGLSAQLRDRAKTIDQQEQFLASDRDIRELMGARQLYIADVLDVGQNGRTQKPYGRIFYTQGKSLIFYAFDLDGQPGFGETKSFQAWGRPDSDQAKPVSLGIFYMDNETNRRWVLKSDDPTLLTQIDAVFVTVEARGGSKKPSGKPFLYAYLRKAPVNHP